MNVCYVCGRRYRDFEGSTTMVDQNGRSIQVHLCHPSDSVGPTCYSRHASKLAGTVILVDMRTVVAVESTDPTNQGEPMGTPIEETPPVSVSERVAASIATVDRDVELVRVLRGTMTLKGVTQWLNGENPVLKAVPLDILDERYDEVLAEAHAFVEGAFV